MASSSATRPLPFPGSASPSQESTFSGPVDPSSARMRILVAPYYSPFIVSFEKVQTWEGLIITLQRLFGPTFCSLALPPTITVHETEHNITADNWEQIACADCSIVVHTKSADTGSQQTSQGLATSGSAIARDRIAPKPRDGPKNDISNPALSAQGHKPRLVNRHANVGSGTPNPFEGGTFTQPEMETSPKEPQTKRKRRGTLWNTVLNVISIVHPISSSSSQPVQQPPQPIVSEGPVTHISSMARTNSRKLTQRRRVKSKRSSRVMMQAPVIQPARVPLTAKFSAGNIMRTSPKRQLTKRRSAHQEPVRRHIAKTGSDCSTCFGDDKNRDSIIMGARLVGGGSGSKQPVVTATPASTQPSPQTRNARTLITADRMEKNETIAVFSSPVIEEFSLQPRKKFRPPSSAAATKTSSLYYESTAPPVPKRCSMEDTGFNAQYKLLDEKTVRRAVDKAAAARKAEEMKKAEALARSRSSHRSGEISPSAKSVQSNRTTFSERVMRSTTIPPKRSRSMGPGVVDSRSTAAARRCEAVASSTSSKGRPANSTIDSYYNASKHSGSVSRAGTVHSSGSRSNNGREFVRQSSPYDNKPLPKLPESAGSDSYSRSLSSAGGFIMGPIATFEELMSRTSSSVGESVEINSIKQVTMVAGQPALL